MILPVTVVARGAGGGVGGGGRRFVRGEDNWDAYESDLVYHRRYGL